MRPNSSCRGTLAAFIAVSIMSASLAPAETPALERFTLRRMVWRTVSDSTNRVVIFDSAMTPATFWVRLDDLDMRPGAPVKKLELAGGKTYSGNAVDKFVNAELFTFADLTDLAPKK